MKRLVIMRHGEADNSSYDYKRNLTQVGVEQVVEKSRLLQSNKFIPDMMFVSSAVRTMQTAQVLKEQWNKEEIITVDKYGLYLCSSQYMEELLYEVPDAVDTLMIVAHNPGMSDLYDRMSSLRKAYPTSGVAVFEFDVERWDDFQAVRPTLVFERL